ncbi:MAG: Holliday junction branch migration protein RuvA [Chlamydiales bacterium]|nr:Holliday junction branch migration protein RuvA [Chlamydiales bacterium]
MLAYIQGKLISASTSDVVILANGLGYRVAIPVNAFTDLPAIGSEVSLHTSFIVREQSHALFGFLSSDERDIFEVLLNVSGIGPKSALSIIGHLRIDDLAKAVNDHDIATMCKVPGIGRKTAERLLLEVRDKLPALVVHSPSSRFAVKVPTDPRSQVISDAMNALIHLGYSQNIAEKAIKRSLEGLPEAIELAQLITTSLKNV